MKQKMLTSVGIFLTQTFTKRIIQCMKKYIHVNQNVIKSNLKKQRTDPEFIDVAPTITIKEGKKNTYCHEVEILGPSKVVYGIGGKQILSCGARVVIETESDIKIIR